MGKKKNERTQKGLAKAGGPRPLDEAVEDAGLASTGFDPTGLRKVIGALGRVADGMRAERETQSDPAPATESAPAPMDGAANAIAAGNAQGAPFTWALDALWTSRLERLADAAGVAPERFLESLLRRAWVSLPTKLRRDDDPTHGT